MSKENIILIGGGGHCKSVITAIELENKFQIAGIVDLPSKVGENIFGYPIIAHDKQIPQLIKEYKIFCITIGQIRSPEKKRNLFEKMIAFGVKLPNIISPLSYISSNAQLGIGNVILHHCIINAGVKIGSNNILNNKSLLEHDVIVGHHNHISTAVAINADCVIGDDNFIGSNSVFVNGISISSNIIIGAGTVVVKNINKSGVYAGNPARTLTKNN